jgi:hypothetical protein
MLFAVKLTFSGSWDPTVQEICPEDVKLAVKLNDAYASGLDSRESVVSRARDVLQKRNWTEFADPRSVQIRYPPGQFSQRSHTYVPGGEAYTEVIHCYVWMHSDAVCDV